MLDGVHLTLLIGPPTAPSPAPAMLLDALQSVQVTAGRTGTGFQLTLGLGKLAPLQSMLATGQLDPMATRVVITVTLKGMPAVISDGIVTQHTLAPSNEPGQSTLTLTGEDLGVLMDVVQKKVSWPAMADYARVSAILAKYAMYGILPSVIPPLVTNTRSQDKGKDIQTEPDLTYIRGLAGLCGYTFYLEPGPVPLQSLAYWGPDVRNAIPQPALSVNSDWDTNVESLSFSLDGLSKRVVVLYVLDPATDKTAIPVPVPNINPLKPPLGARLISPAKVIFPSDATNLAPEEAAKRALGLMREGADSVSGNGSLNVLRYGQILRARQLVGVRGAGLAYDGQYYVESVTHDLKRGDYKQSFTLARDGLVSQTLVVMP